MLMWAQCDASTESNLMDVDAFYDSTRGTRVNVCMHGVTLGRHFGLCRACSNLTTSLL